ncbi:hypothetical protein ACU4GD_27125 [Cupriavidus basilensis]
MMLVRIKTGSRVMHVKPHVKSHVMQPGKPGTATRAEREEEAVDPLSRVEAETLFGERALRPSRMTPGRVVLAQVAVTVLSAIAWRLFAGSGAGAAELVRIIWWHGMFRAQRLLCLAPLDVARGVPRSSGLVVGEAIKVLPPLHCLCWWWCCTTSCAGFRCWSRSCLRSRPTGLALAIR